MTLSSIDEHLGQSIVASGVTFVNSIQDIVVAKEKTVQKIRDQQVWASLAMFAAQGNGAAR